MRVAHVAILPKQATDMNTLRKRIHYFLASKEGHTVVEAVGMGRTCSQTLPVIAVGDYNFDWEVGNGDAGVDRTRDDGFYLLTADGVFSWVRPGRLVRTQDNSFNSVLDFVFVAGDTWTCEVESEIIERPGDFSNDHQTSDHRPC